MNLKVATFICLLAFAFIASQLAVGIAFAETSEVNVALIGSSDGLEGEDGGDVGPQGLPIDTPGGPTKK